MTAIKYRMWICCVAIAVTGSACEQACGQTLQYPPYGSWRGRAVARQGLFRVQRYRWGSGLTPAGAAFLTSAVDAVVPILPTLVGRDAASDQPRAGGLPLSSRDDYVAELRRANDLLARTQQLLQPGSTPASPPAAGDAGQLDAEELQKKFGPNPWQP